MKTPNSFCHSGAFGDLIYSLPMVKHFGGGDFYLHLNQMDWIGSYYYGSAPAPFHKGRLTQADFDNIKSFMEAQSYISKFAVLDPQSTPITHNLDRFRVPFVNHPGNYVDIYSAVFGLTADQAAHVRTTPWLTVPQPRSVPDRPIVINRTQRWIPQQPGPQWSLWREQGMEDRAVFVGLAEEHQAFCQATGWLIPHRPTSDVLEMAEYLAGAATFIGNQSMALSIAIGLGKAFCCELRTDLPLSRNECYFPRQLGGNYF